MFSRHRAASPEPAAIDLSALDPDRDTDAADRLIRNVRAGYQQHYPATPELLVSVWTTSPRALLGAIAIAATMVIAVRLTDTRAPLPPTTVAEAIGIPPEFLERGQPTTKER
jgi:hypothetical protein